MSKGDDRSLSRKNRQLQEVHHAYTIKNKKIPFVE